MGFFIVVVSFCPSCRPHVREALNQRPPFRVLLQFTVTSTRPPALMESCSCGVGGRCPAAGTTHLSTRNTAQRCTRWTPPPTAGASSPPRAASPSAAAPTLPVSVRTCELVRLIWLTINYFSAARRSVGCRSHYVMQEFDLHFFFLFW